jgi:hypothetical protein
VTSCRKLSGKLTFHVDYDDGDSDIEPLGEEGTVFKWHGPRACSGVPPYKDAMRKAMRLLRAQNLNTADAMADDELQVVVRKTPISP